MTTVHVSSKLIQVPYWTTRELWERRYTMTTVHLCSKPIQDSMLCIMTGSGFETKNGLRPDCETQMQMLFIMKKVMPDHSVRIEGHHLNMYAESR